jgi:hypothetical protein
LDYNGYFQVIRASSPAVKMVSQEWCQQITLYLVPNVGKRKWGNITGIIVQKDTKRSSW